MQKLTERTPSPRNRVIWVSMERRIIGALCLLSFMYTLVRCERIAWCPLALGKKHGYRVDLRFQYGLSTQPS